MIRPVRSQPISSPQRPFAPPPNLQMALGCLVIPVLLVAILIGTFVYVRSRATNQLIVPDQEIVSVRTQPDDLAPLVARFGAGRAITLMGRTDDWRWLEVEYWEGRRGWTRRPLSILVWWLNAPPTKPQPLTVTPVAVTPVAEDMVAISATSFTMGSPPGFGESDEHPAHVVHLSAFAIDRTEVTVGQYWRCVAAGDCAAPTQDASPSSSHYISDPAFDNHPIIYVPWAGAQAYCRWRGKRLPTEAEWEAAAGWDAARKAKLRWPWGNDVERPGANIEGIGAGAPKPVGSFSTDRSPAGVLDMGGNVSEWVFDWYKVDYYRVSDATDPTGPTHRRGAGTGRVVRGGSYANTRREARTADRQHRSAAYGYSTVGFRCAKNG